MIAAIHQPNYLPWIGYFTKIRLSDVFIFHDQAEFSKTAVIKRTKIRKAKHEPDFRWLTIPVKKYDRHTPIADIEIDTTADWRREHLRAIQNTYLSARYFAEVYPVLSKGISKTEGMTHLAEINISLINLVSDFLGFSVRFARSTEIDLRDDGRRRESVTLKNHNLNMHLLKSVQADTYISGTGAMAYQDEQEFGSEGIRLVYHDIGKWLETNPYDQGTPVFTGGLSIIDSLMHLGRVGVVDLIDRFIEKTLPDLAT